MARNRTMSPDFWTWEAVIDCPAMTRLLFIGLWNFADDFGVQPLRPRTIRLQVFPGDEIADEAVRAMVDELVAHGLVRIYAVDGVDYLSIVDWALIHRVARRARRRYPRDPALPPEPVPEPAPTPAVPPEVARWRRSVGRSLGHFLPNGAPADTEEWIDRWIADGCDLHCDVLPAISVACRPSPDRQGPPGLAAVAAYAEANRVRRLAVASTSVLSQTCESGAGVNVIRSGDDQTANSGRAERERPRGAPGNRREREHASEDRQASAHRADDR